MKINTPVYFVPCAMMNLPSCGLFYGFVTFFSMSLLPDIGLLQRKETEVEGKTWASKTKGTQVLPFSLVVWTSVIMSWRCKIQIVDFIVAISGNVKRQIKCILAIQII